MTRLLALMRRDRRGVSTIEFAIIAPVLVFLMMGLCDIIYQAYAQAILDGAVQKAARDSAIQGGAENTAAIDARVVAMMSKIVKNPAESCTSTANTATWCADRKNYDSFSTIKPENFTDTNGNGRRDPGECFDDVNGNSQWDADPGLSGQGFADDVTVYTFTMRYPRIFPVGRLVGAARTQTISSKTVLKNQPYATQSTTTVVEDICT